MNTGSKGTNQKGLEKSLPLHVFDLPIQEIRKGYLSDVYFWREKLILERDRHNPRVTMQVFQKKMQSCVESMRRSPSCGWERDITLI